MSETITNRVKEVIAETLEIDARQIGNTDRFVEDLGAQSIQSIELVAAFEEEFDIDMDEEEALTVKSVDVAVEFISKAIAEQHN
jgi:acyl carrier protein